MKKVLASGLAALVVGLLVAGFALPVFGHGPEDFETAPANQEAWEAMHEACENGDWEAMEEAAEEVHGEWGGMGGHMSGSMMGGGWGGMMSW